jgi:hypothetical protein
MSPQIATSTRVDLAGLLEFIRPRHQVVLITARADGSVQASPVTCGVDEAGRILISTYDAMRRQGKSLIRITPRRWGPVATGGFPARLFP